MIEAQVLGTSPLAGKCLKDINWPDGVLVGDVMKENKIIIPKSDTVFSEGDIITVFYRTKDIEQVERLLEVGISFF